MSRDDFSASTGISDTSADSAAGSDSLGSLAQSARTKQLKVARWILIVLGILQTAYGGYFVMNAEKLVKEKFAQEMQMLRMQGMVFDQKKVQELQQAAIKQTTLMNTGGVLVGISFIILGILVFRYPVMSTVTSLILYIGLFAVFAFWLYMDSGEVTHIFQGWLIRIVIIVSLVKAIQAAIAYEKDRESAAPADAFGGVQEF